MLPASVKESLIEKQIDDGPMIIKGVIIDLKQKIHEVFDLKDMAQQCLEEQPELLNDIFLTCGRKEFVFLKNLGALLGLIFGLLQMGATLLFHGYWFDHLLLPI